MPSTTRLRSAARLLTSGLPRLWRAARRSGAGPLAAGDALLLSAWSFVTAARSGPGWRRQNAVRHFVWQAGLAARHGEELAVALAAAQEEGAVDAADSAVDEENNRLGRAWGRAHASTLAGRGRSATLAALAEVADRKWRDRELSAQPLPDGSDPRDARR